MTLNENKKILNENRFQVEKKEAKIKGMNEVLKDLHKKVEEAPVVRIYFTSLDYYEKIRRKK
jgi:hypothetical protein